MIYIYSISDPRNNIVRYVGKTVDLKRRLRSHLNTANKDKCKHCHLWLLKIKAEGVEPLVEILETLTEDADWQTAEKKWISHFKDLGNDLTNIKEGGIGGSGGKGRLGSKWSEEQRLKNRKSRLGIPVSHTEEGNLRRAEGRKRFREENKVPVYQYTLEGIFVKEWESAVDCCKELGFRSHSDISAACKGNRSAYGFQWRHTRQDSISTYIRTSRITQAFDEEKAYILIISEGMSLRKAALLFDVKYETFWKRMKKYMTEKQVKGE